MRPHTSLLGALLPPAVGLVALGCGGGGGGGGFVPPPNNNSGTFGITQREVVSGLTFPTTGPTQPSNYTVDRAFPGLSFSSPVYLTEIPDGTNRLAVVEQGGTIMAFPNQQSATQSQAQTFLDISARLVSGGEEGLLGLAFAPDYATSGMFYVHYSANPPRRSIIARFRRSATNPQVADPNSEEQLLVIPQPFSNHNGGMLAFGLDGMLYISLGDGGSGGDPMDHGQDLSTLLGSMLRIDVRNAPGYAVPADNPFVSQAGAAPEIWAYGLRHPWRFSFDRQTGDLWLGDVGQGAREEISLVTRGANLGWRVYEGNLAYANPQNLPPTSFTPPVLDYDRSGGTAVIGGYVYRGTRVQSLQGAYLHADFGSGLVNVYRPSTQVNQVIGTMPGPSSFGEDLAGEVYITSLQGAIYRVNESTGGVPTNFPQQLSQTGLFTSMTNLTPTAGLVEYDVNVSFWSDGAIKRRWIALPGNESAQFAATGAWIFPLGTVIVKHFEMDLVGGTRRRLETRVLIREAAGWAGYTYVWNQNGTDAVLDSGAGTTIPLQVPAPTGSRNIVYSVPSRAQCLTCHNPAAGSILGVRTEQMNRDFAYAPATDNQLRAFGHVGLITPDPVSGASHVALPRVDDLSQPLEARAKAYLAANCSQCHQPGAVSPVSIDLRFQTPLASMGLVNQTATSGDLGLTNPARIRSGTKESSVLWERIRRRDGSTQMPPIATNDVDQAAVDLIGQWIDGM